MSTWPSPSPIRGRLGAWMGRRHGTACLKATGPAPPPRAAPAVCQYFALGDDEGDDALQQGGSRQAAEAPARLASSSLSGLTLLV